MTGWDEPRARGTEGARGAAPRPGRRPPRIASVAPRAAVARPAPRAPVAARGGGR